MLLALHMASHTVSATHAFHAKRHCLGKRSLSQCGITETIMTRMLIVTTAAGRSAHGRNVRLARPVEGKVAQKNPSVNSEVCIGSSFPRPLQNVMNCYAGNAARLLVEIARRTCLLAQSKVGRRQAPSSPGLVETVLPLRNRRMRIAHTLETRFCSSQVSAPSAM